MTRKQAKYDKDFYAWAMSNAELIRQHKFSELDIDHIAEELESMGKSEKRELASRLAVLIAHLLKWKFQINRRSVNWKLTIKEQRIGILRLLRQSPSLKCELDSTLGDAYEEAVIIAARQTGLEEDLFPQNCPFNFEEYLDHSFFPE